MALGALKLTTWLPPSSSASAAHSGSQANICSRASAMREKSSSAATAAHLNICMVMTLKSMSAVSADGHDVLQKNRIAAIIRQSVARVLQAHPAEFAG